MISPFLTLENYNTMHHMFNVLQKCGNKQRAIGSTMKALAIVKDL